MSNNSFYKGFPVFSGIDFSPNRPGVFGRIPPNLSSAFDATKANPAFVSTPLSTGVEGTSPTEGVYPELAQQLEFERKYFPIYLDKMKAAAELQAQLSQRQLYESYPLLSQAAEETAARTKRYRESDLAFRAGLPEAVQGIMFSKQAQATSAAAGEADRARAVAAQQEAANRYAGQAFKFGVA